MGSYGQTLMRRYLELMFDAKALEDYRPDWMGGLELDLFWPEASFAVEFQGDQHFVPSFGIDALLKQKENDARKRQICAQRGITLLRLAAIDMEYTLLYRKLKAPFKGKHRILSFIKRPWIRRQLKALNREAVAYRATLVENYNSPTARKRGNTRREAKRAAWSKVPIWRIIQAKQARFQKKHASPLPVIGAGMARAKKAEA